jgi:COP9 signalosome complex subunit 5
MIQDPAIAIVIDPKRTIAAGKVEIGCFRAYTNDYAEKKQQKTSSSGLEMIRGEKLEEFGVHCHKYYKIEHSVFKSNIDSLVLERLWNEYWVHTLASSPLLHNADHTDKSVVNVVQKF